MRKFEEKHRAVGRAWVDPSWRVRQGETCGSERGKISLRSRDYFNNEGPEPRCSLRSSLKGEWSLSGGGKATLTAPWAARKGSKG